MTAVKPNPDAKPRNNQWFVSTHWTVILNACRNDSEAGLALEELCQTYWYPLYFYVRRRGFSAHDAQDLTQEFFARLLRSNGLSNVAPAKGRFRSFLLAAMNHLLANERERLGAGKRGGGAPAISLDAIEEQYELEPKARQSPEKDFERRWATTLLEQAYAGLREEFRAAGKSAIFEQLSPFLLDGTDSGAYATLAPELGMSPNAIAAAVRRLRKQFRACVRREIARTVGSSREVEAELRHLHEALGVG